MEGSGDELLHVHFNSHLFTGSEVTLNSHNELIASCVYVLSLLLHVVRNPTQHSTVKLF